MIAEITRPQQGEYLDYHPAYIDQVRHDPIEQLHHNLEEVTRIFEPLTEAQGNFAYAQGKWSLKQLLGHIIDAERIFTYRAMRFARNDDTPLPSFDENLYAVTGNFNERTLTSLLEEYQAVRQSTLALFGSFSPEMLLRKGLASGGQVSVRAYVWITAGHETHHLGVIKERYLPLLPVS